MKSKEPEYLVDLTSFIVSKEAYKKQIPSLQSDVYKEAIKQVSCINEKNTEQAIIEVQAERISKLEQQLADSKREYQMLEALQAGDGVIINTLQQQLAQEREANRWIPVSERLPKSGVKVFAQFKNENGKVRTICAKYVEKFTEEEYESELDCDYNEEQDCYYVPEGWYETLENWSDYTFITVDEGKIYQWKPINPPSEVRE